MSEEIQGALSLRNIKGGAAIEQFDQSISEVVENICDPNTEATAVRKITLVMTVKPSKERNEGVIEVACSSKLAAPVAFATRAYFGQQGDLFIAFEDDPKQTTIGDYITANRENVEPIAPVAPADEGSAS